MTDFLRCQVGLHEVMFLVEDVVTVLRAVALDPLPGAPESVAGVVDLHGELVPVLSVRRRFGLSDRTVQPSDALVLVAVAGRRLLLLVDEAQTIEAVADAQIRDAEELIPGARYVRAIAGAASGPVVVSDLGAFLSSDEVVALDAAVAARGHAVAPA